MSKMLAGILWDAFKEDDILDWMSQVESPITTTQMTDGEIVSRVLNYTQIDSDTDSDYEGLILTIDQDMALGMNV